MTLGIIVFVNKREIDKTESSKHQFVSTLQFENIKVFITEKRISIEYLKKDLSFSNQDSRELKYERRVLFEYLINYFAVDIK